MPVTALLRRYDRVLLDLDGCVWVGDEATPRAPEAVTALREGGARIAFVTNNAMLGTDEFVRKLWGLGFQASLEEVVTPGGALQHRLAERADRLRTAFVIGASPVHRHVADSGVRILNDTDLASRADVVVVSGYEGIDYDDLRVATQALSRGAEFLASDLDPAYPMADGPWPGTGSIVAALEYATGQKAVSVGKPEPALFETALDRLGPGRALVVGDRLDADLAGAEAAGLDAAIVLTGVTTLEQAEAAREPAPVAIAATLGDLVLGDRGGG
jgi:HAD superfamily hydrolase (TIGR01450 family)